MDDWIFRPAIRVPIVLLALTVHEFCHAWFAYRMGDPTAYRMGRCTLNPLKHLDPLGTICLLFAPIGWAKPVPVNPLNFHDYRKGELVTTAAGPLSNLAMAFVFALLLRGVYYLVLQGVGGGEHMARFHVVLIIFCYFGVLLNVGLAVFNCLPLYPLDGFHIASNLGRPEFRRWMEETRHYGPFLILGLVFISRAGDVNILGRLIEPPARFLLHYVAGGDPFAG
ncbi:MAG: site-2 protease family protein [Phycisphaerales bacterium]|nr:site-2 protease family protein [Phycisphaerales bacterium]